MPSKSGEYKQNAGWAAKSGHRPDGWLHDGRTTLTATRRVNLPQGPEFATTGAASTYGAAMDRKIINGWIVVAILAISSTASAQEFSQGVRPAGMGDAFTSVAVGTDALHHNPAGAARAVMYALDASYEYTPEGNVLSASVVDSKTNPNVAAGIAYGYYFGRGDNDLRGHDIRLGLAIPVLPERISVGVGGRYLLIKDTILQESPDTGEEVQTDVQRINGPTLDAGILFKASNQLHLGIVGQNLIDQCHEACEPTPARHIAPTRISGGIGFSTESGFLIAGDGGVDLTDSDSPALDAGVGAEYLIQGMVPLRAGYQYRGAFPQHLLTIGAGWRSSAAGVDLGYQLDLLDTSNMFIMGSFSVYM